MNRKLNILLTVVAALAASVSTSIFYTYVLPSNIAGLCAFMTGIPVGFWAAWRITELKP